MLLDKSVLYGQIVAKDIPDSRISATDVQCGQIVAKDITCD